jgi:hypothetical protein
VAELTEAKRAVSKLGAEVTRLEAELAKAKKAGMERVERSMLQQAVARAERAENSAKSLEAMIAKLKTKGAGACYCVDAHIHMANLRACTHTHTHASQQLSPPPLAHTHTAKHV